MTRKDYQAIAEVINLADFTGLDGDNTRRRLAKEMAEVLAHDNQRFDLDRFMLACGVTDQVARRPKPFCSKKALHLGLPAIDELTA